MRTLKHHFVHHRVHMLGCLVGALIAFVGGLVAQPVIAIGGAVICGAFCLDMIRTMAVRPKRG
jgi:hypothetical protein